MNLLFFSNFYSYRYVRFESSYLKLCLSKFWQAIAYTKNRQIQRWPTFEWKIISVNMHIVPNREDLISISRCQYLSVIFDVVTERYETRLEVLRVQSACLGLVKMEEALTVLLQLLITDTLRVSCQYLI